MSLQLPIEPPMGQVIGVKEFLEILNETLGFAYPSVTIEGEVSGISYKDYGAFFSLKDEEAVISCLAFKQALTMPIENGMKIRVTGKPEIFAKYGKFSFKVHSIELAGEGELARAYEILKKQLEAEGLFANERKRELPKYPRTIGLITSAQSAAYADFLRTLNNRWGGVKVILADVAVQGASSPGQIVAALDHFNHLASPPDVMVLIRGGGSLEDLQAFNTEPVARAVAASRVPIVVGVGHEIDTSLSDYAADMRAITPTNAGELVVPDRLQVARVIDYLCMSSHQNLRRQLVGIDQKIDQLVLPVERFVEQPLRRLDELRLSISRSLAYKVSASSQKLDLVTRLLKGFDPTANLKRGYAIVRAKNKLVRTPSQVSKGESIVIQLAEGNLGAVVSGK